jgi:hypothetical protein
MPDIKSTIYLDDKLSPAMKSASDNVRKESANIEKSTKRVGDSFGQLAKQVLSIEIMRRAAAGLASTLKQAEGYSDLVKNAKSASDAFASSIGRSLMPTVTELTNGFKELSKYADVVGNTIGGAFAAVVASIKTLAVPMYKMMETIVAFPAAMVAAVAAIPPQLLPKGWGDGIDDAAYKLEQLRLTFKIAGDDMAADAKKSWGNVGAIFGGELKAGKGAPVKEAGDTGKKAKVVDVMTEYNDAMYELAQREYERKEKEKSDLEENEKAKYDIMLKWQEEEVKMRDDAQKRYDEQQKLDLERFKMNQSIKLDAATTFFGGFSALLAVAGKKSKEAAIAAKALAITQATIDGISAAIKAWNAGMSVGGPYAPAVAAAYAAGSIAFTAAQIAQIATAKFAQGGIVGGNSYSGDRVNARLNSGEMVLTQQQQAQLFNMANGRGAGNQSISMGGDTIIIQGSADSRAIEAIKKTKEDQLESLRGMIKELSYRGRLSFA